jgi:transcriptional regulator with XRE-family HTH domain
MSQEVLRTRLVEAQAMMDFMEKKQRFIGTRMKAERLRQNMTLAQFGRKLGVSTQMIYKYEIGFSKFTISRLLAVADALNKPVTYFLGEMPK